MNRKIVFVSGDVFFWARVEAAARAAGCEAVRASDEPTMENAFRLEGVCRVIVDLNCRGIDIASWAARWKATAPAPQLVAFGSHVDAGGLEAARTAGFDVVMANSQFHRSLREWIS